ncbi:MAG: acyl-CoA dehydrogenase family protein, partial [Pseudomonas sp.]
MSDYRPPLRDVEFLFNEVFDIPALWARMPALAEHVDGETAKAILEQAGKVIAQQVAPLNRSGDEQGCHWEAGRVTTPEGFVLAYRTYADDGWIGVSGDCAYGGMGMPKVIGAQVEEMLNAANLSFALYSMLTAGAALSLLNHASEALKAKYLPPMYEGRWAGSMCLTEPHA